MKFINSTRMINFWFSVKKNNIPNTKKKRRKKFNQNGNMIKILI